MRPLLPTLLLAAACGGKVVFDGPPRANAGGAGGASSHATTQTAGPSVVQSVASVGPQASVVSATASTGMGCGSFVTGNPPCDQCITINCCAENLACDAGTACDLLTMCIGACAPGDQGCQMACDSKFSSGVPTYQARATCIQVNCGMECGGQGMGICDSGLSTNKPQCDSCMGASCCAPTDACSGGQHGMNMAQLMKCLADCAMMPPGPLCKPILDCQTANCKAACM